MLKILLEHGWLILCVDIICHSWMHIAYKHDDNSCFGSFYYFVYTFVKPRVPSNFLV